MAGEDRLYYEERAAAEIELARRATHAGAVRAHYELANFYLDRLYPPEEPSTAE